MNFKKSDIKVEEDQGTPRWRRIKEQSGGELEGYQGGGWARGTKVEEG